MAYSREVYDKARSELDRRREKAELINFQRTEEIRQRFPEIYEQEMRVRNTFFELASAMLGKGGDAQEAVEKIRAANEEGQRSARRMLKANGYPEDYLDTPYFCMNCKDTGSKGGYTCDCMKQLLRKYASEELRNVSTIKEQHFENARFDLYKDERVRASMMQMADFFQKYCRDFKWKDENRSMLFMGSTGTGKTFFASCIATELIAQGVAVTFASAYELFSALEEEKFKNKQTDSKSAAIHSDLLIIDDLGSEFKTAFTEAELFGIINSRINLSLPTIVTTNLSSEELKRLYNDRITSRIFGFLPCRFSGGDMRTMLAKGSL